MLGYSERPVRYKKRCRTLLILVVFLTSLGLRPANAELVAFWELDEAHGRIASDSSGNNNDGLLQGNPTWVTGQVGGALEFDGVDDFIDVDRRIVQGSFSFALWLQYHTIKGVGGATSIMHNDAWFPGSIRIHLRSSRKFDVGISSENDTKRIDSLSLLSQGQWYHLIVTCDISSDVARIYINGLLDREVTSFGVRAPWIGPMNIGAWRIGDRYFDGLMDDICIFNHALEEDEVRQLYDRRAESFVSPVLRKLIAEIQEAKRIAAKQGPQKATVFLERKIGEYELWKEKNADDVALRHELFSSDLHFLLAEAKEAAGAPTRDVSAAYERSVLQLAYRSNYVPALLWLYRNVSTSRYVNAIKKSVHNSSGVPDNFRRIATDFELSGNWAAFKLFFDTIFSEANDNISFAEAIADGLSESGPWAQSFSDYAKNKPELAKYITNIYEERAEERVAQNKFSKAVKIYRDLASKCASGRDKSVYEFEVCECVFKSGEYGNALSELNDFINNSNSVNKDLIAEAMMMKGRAHIQLGEIDRALDTFSELTREYPQVKRAPAAGFFIGYCYVLQGKNDKAAEALNMVARSHPQSSYAGKARVCLARIRGVTQ